MRARTRIPIFFSVLFIAHVVSLNHAQSVMQVPAGQAIYTYPATEGPERGPNPSWARPIGVGAIANCGDTLSLSVAAERFSGAVDLYLAISLAGPGGQIYFFGSDAGALSLSEELVTWKNGVAGPVDETLFVSIPTVGFPKGRYNLCLLACPAGRLDVFYLWLTFFEVRPPAASSGPVSKSIGPKGGVIQMPDRKVTLEIPPGALSSPTLITIQPASFPEDPNIVPGTGYQFLPSGILFARPARLTLCYKAEDVPVEEESRLALYRLVPLVPGRAAIAEARPSGNTLAYANSIACQSLLYPASAINTAMDPSGGFEPLGENDDCGFVTGGEHLAESGTYSAEALLEPVSARMGFGYVSIPDSFHLSFGGQTHAEPLPAGDSHEACSSALASLAYGRAKFILYIANVDRVTYDILVSWDVQAQASDKEYAYYIYDIAFFAKRCGGALISNNWVMPAYSEEHGGFRKDAGSRRIRVNGIREVELTVSPYANVNSNCGEGDPPADASISGYLEAEILPVFPKR